MSKLAEELARQIVDRLDVLSDDLTIREYARRARSEVAALLEPHLVGEWQDIESAPKDGSTVILYWPGYGNGVTVGFYLDNSMKGIPWKGWRVFSGQIARHGQPTLWQPLPSAPPKGEQSHE